MLVNRDFILLLSAFTNMTPMTEKYILYFISIIFFLLSLYLMGGSYNEYNKLLKMTETHLTHPALTLQMGNFKLEVDWQIRQEDEGFWLIQRKIMSIGKDYINKTESYQITYQPTSVRGEIPFQVEFLREDEETNMSGASIENFKRRWNDDPISKIIS